MVNHYRDALYHDDLMTSKELNGMSMHQALWLAQDRVKWNETNFNVTVTRLNDFSVKRGWYKTPKQKVHINSN